MSRADIEHMRRGVEHFRRTGEALWAEMAPDCEMHDHDLPDAVTYRGHEGWREWRSHFSEAWDSDALELEEYIDAGDGRVVLLARLSARGKGSGVEVERREGIMWTIRDGKTVRIDYYSSPDEALEAAGVEEHAVSADAARASNVELVRRLYESGGPFSLPLGPDAERVLFDRLFAEYYDEQVEVRMPPDYPEGEQVLYGRQGMSRLLAMLRDSWTEWRFEAERFIDAVDRVIVFIRVVARGGASGLVTERETAHVWSFRNGRLSVIQIYRDREEALEAAGLLEGA
jgi:ketosteroid isomerase-like protein